MAKPKISAKSAAADIKSGMDHAELMTKYGLSARGLEILFQKLIENHIVTESEISAIGQISAKSIQPENQQTPAEPPRGTNQVMEVAKQQKRLLWLILLQVLVGILLLFKTGSTTTGAPELTEGWSLGAYVRSLIFLGLAIGCAYFVCEIGWALKVSTLSLVITIILLFVPVISLGALLYMDNKATTFLREAGVRVGLMGAKKKSLAHVCKLG